MDDTQALKVISALANGIDPTNNEPVEMPPLLQNVEVVRALYVAVRALETSSRSRTRMSHTRAPANASKSWTEAEDRLLLERFDTGQTLAQLASTHERTPAGIQARLERHGRMRAQGLQWRGRAGKALAGEIRGEPSDT